VDWIELFSKAGSSHLRNDDLLLAFVAFGCYFRSHIILHRASKGWMRELVTIPKEDRRVLIRVRHRLEVPVVDQRNRLHKIVFAVLWSWVLLNGHLVIACVLLPDGDSDIAPTRLLRTSSETILIIPRLLCSELTRLVFDEVGLSSHHGPLAVRNSDAVARLSAHTTAVSIFTWQEGFTLVLEPFRIHRNHESAWLVDASLLVLLYHLSL